MAEESTNVESTKWIVPVNKYRNEENDYSLEFLPFGFSESLVLLWHGKNRKRGSTSSPSRASSKKKFNQRIVRISDTLTNYQGRLSWFFFSDKQKSILKKNTPNVEIPNILKSFRRQPVIQKAYTLRKNIPHTYSSKESKIIAMYIEEKRSFDGVCMTSLQYFNQEQLVHHLRYHIPRIEGTRNFLLIKHIPCVTKNSKNEFFDKLYFVKWTPRSLLIEPKVIMSYEIFEPQKCYEPVPAHVKAQVLRITETITQFIKYLTDELLKPRVINFVCKEDMYGNVWFLWMNKIHTSCVEVKAPVQRIHYEMKIAFSMASKEQRTPPSTIHVRPSLSRLGSRRSKRPTSSRQKRMKRLKSSNKMDLFPPKWTCPGCVTMKTDPEDCEFISYRTIISKYEAEEGYVAIPPVIQLIERKLSEFRYNRIRKKDSFLERQAQVCQACAEVYQKYTLQNQFRKTEIRKVNKRKKKKKKKKKELKGSVHDSTDFSLLESPDEENESIHEEEKSLGKKPSKLIARTINTQRKVNLININLDEPPVYRSTSSRSRSKRNKNKKKKNHNNNNGYFSNISNQKNGSVFTNNKKCMFSRLNNNHLQRFSYRSPPKNFHRNSQQKLDKNAPIVPLDLVRCLHSSSGPSSKNSPVNSPIRSPARRPTTMGGYGRRKYFSVDGKMISKRNSHSRRSKVKVIKNVGQLKKMQSDALLRMIQEEKKGTSSFQWVDL